MTIVAVKRTIDGKVFRKVDSATSKAEATRLAANRKKQGLLVRIIPLKSAYTKERYGIYCFAPKALSGRWPDLVLFPPRGR